MNNFYQKIKNKKIDVDIDNIIDKPIKQYSTENSVNLTYWSIKPEYRDQLLEHIPKALHDIAEISVCKIQGKGMAVPHKDHNCISKINIYIKTDNSLTIFYNEKENISGVTYNNEQKSHIYRFNDIVKADSFKANDFDHVILDVSKVHSVTMRSGIERTMISYAFANLEFSDLVKYFID